MTKEGEEGRRGTGPETPTPEGRRRTLASALREEDRSGATVWPQTEEGEPGALRDAGAGEGGVVPTPLLRLSAALARRMGGAPLAPTLGQSLELAMADRADDEKAESVAHSPPSPPATARRAVAPPALVPALGLGDQLLAGGLISRDQMRVAHIEQKRSGAPLGQVLVDLGFITDGVLAEVLAQSSGHDRFDAAATLADPAALAPLPEREARRLRVFPVGLRGSLLRLAMADPLDVVTIDEVRRHYGRDVRIEPVVSSEAEIAEAIDRSYGHVLALDGVLRELETLGAAGADPESLRDTDSHPVVRLVNALLLDAVKRRASDLHFEPEGAFLRVRLRIDGTLSQTLIFHKQYWPAVAQRLKILAGMNIADRLGSQDGRFSMSIAHRKIDFRASVIPTVHGENMVLRVLDRSATPLKLEQLALAHGTLDPLELLVRRPEGLLLVTGPTGSGKTTTLYALMDHISGPEITIVTLEDPVEYDLPLLRQTQVREGARLGFADGIRALLRQDPDVMLVGEIRDADTAAMALRAAMTGHQVYATLHANDAPSALPRLMDLGLRPGLLAGSLIGVLAQRLVRRLCPQCRQSYRASPVECKILGLDATDPPEIFRARGCEACGQTGYHGRVPISELLSVSPEIDDLIASAAPLAEIRALATRQGYRPMLDDGARLVCEGVIDVAALMRAIDVTRRLA
ncbi:type II secretion system protein E [Rhodospirillum rubrum]|uniref:GspE/PulE family protein n=1 Tax=Rhodospirillum rubrum TaxID=1085 RepID=UPI001905F021|nr:GspE/PulE family protein [Rhodospirillum rubrum]MBK1664366.1 type II secretion system protein E [Rhodospirillum rubrum]MBK1676120.1 type II secretion system protein E [Rhodospirillum rubrum]